MMFLVDIDEATLAERLVKWLEVNMPFGHAEGPHHFYNEGITVDLRDAIHFTLSQTLTPRYAGDNRPVKASDFT